MYVSLITCIPLFFFFKGYGAPRDLPSSPPRRSSDLGGPRHARRQRQADAGERRRRDRAGDPDLLRRALRGERREARGRLPPDRKSTRLNSSHANISYAVFCLKKKNKIVIPYI